MPNNFGRERRQSAEERARRIVQETLWDVGLTPAQSQLIRGNAEVKVQLARRLRQEATLSLKAGGTRSFQQLSSVDGF